MDQTFIVSPPTQRFSLEAGGHYEGHISVTNPLDATSDFSYIATPTTYSVVGELYDADFTAQTDYTKLSEWITITNPTGTVAPNHTVNIDFTIDVPADAPGGGQYAAIAVSSNNSTTSEASSIGSVFEIASLIYADVAGETIRSGEIINNSVPQIVFNPPVTLSATLKNSGNIHQDATVKITAKNVFTGEVIYPKEDDAKSFNEIVMPGTTRLANRNIDNLPSLGVFHVSQEITYLGQTSLVEKDLIICPIWFLVLVVATLVAVIYTIISSILKHRRTSP